MTPLNLDVPASIFDAAVQQDDFHAGLRMVQEHMDPDHKEDLGGWAGLHYSEEPEQVWQEMDAAHRRGFLEGFVEFMRTQVSE